MTTWSRSEIVARLREKIRNDEPIIAGGAGTGLSAMCEEAGGIDLIVIYNSGRFRMAGRGSLAGLMPYGNANDIVKQMAYEVLPVVRRTPVLAGICGTDPFMLTDVLLRELKELGFAGIMLIACPRKSLQQKPNGYNSCGAAIFGTRFEPALP